MLASASGKLKALSELTAHVPVPRSLTVQQKVVLGGAGALTPIVLNLLVVDPTTTFRNVTLIVIAAYLLKVVMLFYLGGMTAALHRQEEDPRRLFELGIVAPALLTAFLNGSNGEKHDRLAQKAEPASGALAWMLPTELLAENVAPLPEVYSFRQPPPESIGQQFLRGLVGQTRRGPWFVCVRPTELGLSDAGRLADDLRRRFGVSARVYGTDGGPSGSRGTAMYTVVIADWTSEDAARAIGRHMREQGVANAFEWMRP